MQRTTDNRLAYLTHPRRQELIERHYGAPAILRSQPPHVRCPRAACQRLDEVARYQQPIIAKALRAGDIPAARVAARTARAAWRLAERIRAAAAHRPAERAA
ncbi:hypothetical protein [Algiphilus sp.]|uniref:hypothetical protein n=1 Tax=Algiphilus sp. TaxID=1872431 RepID=UPI0025C5F400|nr:hypothetical protein [Algiphilus sp.]MCK5769495.1 hypothetical protein [Algiphilus sp.]